MTFTPMGAAVWGLGPYDNPDLQLNGIDAAGVLWVCSAVQGWKTTTVEAPVLRRAGGDGGWFGPGTRAPKVLTLTGAFRACATDEPTARAQLWAAEAQLRAAAEHYAEDTTLWVGGDVPKQMTVRLTGSLDVVDVSPWFRTFSCVFTAADPYKYAAGAAGLVTLSTGLTQATGSFGLQFPAAFPASFATGVTTQGGRIAAVNTGGVPTYPTVTYDPGQGGAVLDTPLLRHLGLGVAEGVGTQIPPGAQVVVDHANKTVLLGGRSIYSQRAGGSVFFPLALGGNDLSFSANAYNATATVTVTYRPRWS